MMDNACAMNGSTLPHEIGHYFSLYHTHGKTNNGTTDELVDGTNCADTGDDICDTPADPNLSGKVQNSNCAYTGTDTDANGAAFVPNTRNIMSYSTKACRDEFSTGQYERIRNGYEQGRPNLSQNNILADFEEESLTLCEGSSFSFTNNSIGASSFLWTFEGGQPASSTEENPTVIYMNEGSFEVSLLIENGLGDQDVKVVGDKIKIESIPDAQTLPRVGSFENAQIQERILSSDESTFELTNTGASDGVQSIFIDNFSQNLQGSKDYLVLGNLNESSNTILELTFDYAYAPYSDDIFDRLEIGYRDPCALDWNILWRKEGNDLATTDATTSFFTPSIEDWKTEQVKFAIPQELDNIEIAIINTNGYGNAVYFDNYIVTSEGDFAFGDFAVQNTSCPDSVSGSIEVEIIGSGQYEYSLDGQNFSNENTFHDLPVGSYTVYVRNQEGVLITEFVEVASAYEYPEKPVITQNAQGLLTFTGSTVQSIQWYVDDFPVAGANGSQFRFDEFGTVTLRVANGTCEVVSDPFVILSLGEDKLGFEMYPNPVSDQLHFKFAVNLLRSFTIRDLLGKEKAVIIDSSKGVVLDTRLLSAGYYLVTIEEAGTTTTLPLVKQ
ncbi:MAG: T9SS type A sorting domain-containing protein [Bacteroidota bacterium]